MSDEIILFDRVLIKIFFDLDHKFAIGDLLNQIESYMRSKAGKARFELKDFASIRYRYTVLDKLHYRNFGWVFDFYYSGEFQDFDLAVIQFKQILINFIGNKYDEIKMFKIKEI